MRRLWSVLSRFLAGAAIAATMAASTPSHSGIVVPQLKTLYSFCRLQPDCTDGANSHAALVMDSAGNLYGTTTGGGGAGEGTVFELELTSTGYKHHVLHAFCKADSTCGDGASPVASLILDTNGALYGTTSAGGAHGAGTVFELSLNSGTWHLATLYSFCAKTACADGSVPVTALTYQGVQTGALYSGRAPLYGVTQTGGRSCSLQQNGCGVVFSLNFVRGQIARKESVIYKFCSTFECSDGAMPQVGNDLTIDAAGDLYGTTYYGGYSPWNVSFGPGVVYELSATSNGFSYIELSEFCQQSNCSDGVWPDSRLFRNGRDVLFGATWSGGNGQQGTIFKLAPGNPLPKETVLYNFCSQPNCADGKSPWAPLTPDGSGNFIGTTYAGTDDNHGVVFKLNGRGTYSVLYTFCSVAACGDGIKPIGGVVRDSSGNLFGTTYEDGDHGAGGTVFELAP